MAASARHAHDRGGGDQALVLSFSERWSGSVGHRHRFVVAEQPSRDRGRGGGVNWAAGRSAVGTVFAGVAGRTEPASDGGSSWRGAAASLSREVQVPQRIELHRGSGGSVDRKSPGFVRTARGYWGSSNGPARVAKDPGRARCRHRILFLA